MCPAPQDVVLEALCAPLLSFSFPVQVLWELEVLEDATGLQGCARSGDAAGEENEAHPPTVAFLQVMR
jgi:hypothetical protein